MKKSKTMKRQSPPTPSFNQDTTMTLARLLSQRQWTLLETILTSSAPSSIVIDDPTLPHAITSDIVVHFAARFQAPLRILSLLARRYPQSLASSDVTGRYPIHVAAKWGATPDVIAYLIKTNPAMAGVPDTTGKTPMHYVGECYLQHFDNVLYSRDESMLQVVRLLKNTAPQSVNLEDDDGMNAIEYALINDANIKVVKTMQRACRDDWRDRAKPSSTSDMSDAMEVEADVGDTTQSAPASLGRRRHQDLVADIETMALKLQREYSGNLRGGKTSPNGEKVHLHRSSARANTQAARTA